MKNEQVDKFLKGLGYRFYAPAGYDPDFVFANYFRAITEGGVPDCLGNEKPPQFHVRCSELGGDFPQSFTLDICGMAPQGWVKLDFYSLNVKELLSGIEAYETALKKAWTALFE